MDNAVDAAAFPMACRKIKVALFTQAKNFLRKSIARETNLGVDYTHVVKEGKGT